MIVDFEADVYRWAARPDAGWYFVALPPEVSEEVRERQPPLPRGFGAVRVDARIGETRWRTSIFPDSTAGAYVLPLKRAVRDAEGLTEGQLTRVRLEIVDA